MPVSTHGCVGECYLIASHQAADVVAVHVGDVDLVDLRRPVARRLQVVDLLLDHPTQQIATHYNRINQAIGAV